MDLAIIPLDDIRFVLLDMDGTLLDRYFDDYFWEHFVPRKYAERHNITFAKAKKELLKRYSLYEGTLKWTDLDFWSEELSLDISALKEQIGHLVEVHPYVEDFLQMLKRKMKKVFLVTNAYYKTIELKLRNARIGKYFDSIVSSFDVGYPKENIEFWKGAEKRLGFDKERTLLVDDTEDVLKAAKEYGIRYLLYKAKANSKIRPRLSKDFLYIFDFNELL